MKKFLILAFLALCTVSFANEILFRMEMKKDALDKIAIRKNFVLQNVGKTSCLYLKGQKVFEFNLPEELAQFDGEILRVTYRYKLKNVPKPKKAHLGFKIMIAYKYGQKSYVGHAPCPSGTKDWTWAGYNFRVNKNAKNMKLAVVLPTAGEVWVSDITVSYQNKKGRK